MGLIIEIIDVILTLLAVISPYIIMYIIKRRKKCYNCGSNLFTWSKYEYIEYDDFNLYNKWKCIRVGCNQSIITMEIKKYILISEQIPSKRYNLKQRIKIRIRVWYIRKKGKSHKIYSFEPQI